MGINRGNYKTLGKLLVVMFVVIAVLLLSEVLYLNYFNKRVFCIEGADNSGPVQMSIGGREDGTSAWQKKGFNLYDEYVDLYAQTIDGTIVNSSRYNLKKWQMRINFNDDCFINNAWCGNVEIHQDVLNNEKVQTLDLRNYTLDNVRLDYLYDGDLLIPLHKGDYVIYYPSVKDQELQIKRNSQLTMGFIVYYLDFPDLSDYEVTYNYDRQFYEGHQFYILFVLAVVWILLLVIFTASYITYKSAEKEMEIKKSGILSMSDMYSMIYIMDLVESELIPVIKDEEFENTRQRNLTPAEQIDKFFKDDCKDEYKNLMAEVIDAQSIRERLANNSTFAYEYDSKEYGWRRVRLFPMQDKDDSVLNKIVFAVQDINEEKSIIEEVQKRIDTVEHENKEKSIFLANMSHEIRTPINTVIGFDTMILRESKDPVIRSYAKSINSAANMLLSLINGILDVSKLEAEKMEIIEAEYSLKKMMIEIVNMVKARSEFDNLEFICDVAPNVVDSLYGDSVRLKQVIINLLTNAAKYTDKGSVKISVYGKAHDDMMHLLFSVKDTGIGIKAEDLGKLTERFQRFDDKRNHKVEGTGIGLNLVTGILDLMGSELHVISKYGEGSEFYFELEQKIAKPDTVGELNLTDDMADEDEYQALFVAPEAEVLVVDDNAMNLKVFVDLLKETELRIDTASSGAAALELTNSKKYDLIFMDHMMPEMDGIETFNRIRDNKKGLNVDTAVIILTANALKGAEAEYSRVGFDDFLPKPIQPEILEQMVVKHLDPAKVNMDTSARKKETVALPTIAGVDVAYGLTHTGGVSNYTSLLNQFAAVAKNDLEELNSYAEAIKKDRSDKGAIGSYRIKVHSMKSSANILGALQVYGVAATLEELASKEEVDGICSITPYFNISWNNLADAVIASLPESEEKKEISNKETIENLLHLLETSIKAYDIKSADNLLGKLNEYKWDDKKKELMTQLDTAVANLDAEKVVFICRAMRD